MKNYKIIQIIYIGTRDRVNGDGLLWMSAPIRRPFRTRIVSQQTYVWRTPTDNTLNYFYTFTLKAEMD